MANLDKDFPHDDFDDIDDLALSLQNKIKELNETSHLLDEDVSKPQKQYEFEDLKARLNQQIEEQNLGEPENNTSSSKTIFIIISLIAVLIVISLLTFFMLANDPVATDVKHKEISLDLPIKKNKEGTLILSENVAQDKANTILPSIDIRSTENNNSSNIASKLLKEEKFLTRLEDSNKVKTIPLLFLDDSSNIKTIDAPETVDTPIEVKKENVEKNTQIPIETNSDQKVSVEKNKLPLAEEKIKAKNTNNDLAETKLVPIKDMDNQSSLKLNFKHQEDNEIGKGKDRNPETKVNREKEKSKTIESLVTEPDSSNIDIKTSLNKQQISKVIPDIIIGSSQKQWLTIVGKHFDKNTVIKLSWEVNKSHRTKLFSLKENKNQFEFNGSNEIKLHINTGLEKARWFLSLNDQDSSELLFFDVYSPYFEKTSKPEKSESKKKLINSQNKIARMKSSNSSIKILTRPNEFTIQLLGSSNLTMIKNIISKYPKINSLEWVKTKRKNQNWYSLIYGHFKNKKLAKEAYKKLPKKLQGKSFWVRSIKDILKNIETKKKIVKKERIGTKNPQILSISKDLWTLELMSFNTLAKLRLYKKNNKLGALSNYFTKKIAGKVRYTLIYGIYSSRKKALLGLNQLPYNVKIAKPWLKQYKEIQKTMM